MILITATLELVACFRQTETAKTPPPDQEPLAVAQSYIPTGGTEPSPVVSASPVTVVTTPTKSPVSPADFDMKMTLKLKYEHKVPREWGEVVTGVKRRLATTDLVVALTFDACGGPGGNGYDKTLIDFLKEENIPATLFINSRWIAANPDTFHELANNPLFEIENHGKQHKPLSVNGKSAYGIKGTASIGEVVDEAFENELNIEKLTGRKPKLFRSGTAFYDDVAVQVISELGLQPVNFDVLGDAGATFTAKQIEQALDKVKSGSIVICHMNQPDKDTAAGIKLAVPKLRSKGFSFVKLEEYPLE
jgi:peptidoglycan/xylan/chitin deacetylase (PgdA/CDA1 family)